MKLPPPPALARGYRDLAAPRRDTSSGAVPHLRHRGGNESAAQTTMAERPTTSSASTPAATGKSRRVLIAALKIAAVAFCAELAAMFILRAVAPRNAWWPYLAHGAVLTLVVCVGLRAVGVRVPTEPGQQGMRRYLTAEKWAWALIFALVALAGAAVWAGGHMLAAQDTATNVELHIRRQLVRAHALLRRATAKAMRTADTGAAEQAQIPFDELGQEVAAFERVTRGLIDGDAELGLRACPIPEVRTQLELVAAAWAPVADLLQRLADTSQAENVRMLAAQLERAGEKLVRELETADLLVDLDYRQQRINTLKAILPVLLLATATAAAVLLAIFGRLVRSRRQLDRQIAEQTAKLARSETRFRTVINASKDAIVAIGPDGRIILFNPAAEHMFGRCAAEMIGQPLDLLMPQEYRERHAKYVADYFRQGRSCRGVIGKTVELTALRADGTRFPVELSLSDGQSEDQRFVLAVIRDVSESRRLQQRLVHAQKLESIGQLAAGIAHEINTPTQFVGDNMHFLARSFSDLLTIIQQCRQAMDAACGGVPAELAAQIESTLKEIELDYLVQEIPRAIEQSLDGLARITKIVRAMKDFSHPGSERREPTDINRAIESTITVARNAWKYVANVVTDFDPSLPLVPLLAGDFNQVILNILVNAADAIADVVGDGSKGKGTITVRTRRVGDWAEIRISDTGTGIPENIRDKIFDPFFTTKPTGRGTGQGLAIAHNVVVGKHQGTIEFESKVGKGTTFIIRLPLYEPLEAGETCEPESNLNR